MEKRGGNGLRAAADGNQKVPTDEVPGKKVSFVFIFFLRCWCVASCCCYLLMAKNFPVAALFLHFAASQKKEGYIKKRK